MLRGLMMEGPLLISSLIEHADRYHGDTEIVSRQVESASAEDALHRCTYRGVHRRARRLANAIEAMPLRRGDRIATLAWNGYRHLELYFAVSGAGFVLHTINPRPHPDQTAAIVNNAEDSCLFFDLTFLPIVEAIAEHCRTIKAYVVMTDRAHMPDSSGSKLDLICYEDLIDRYSDRYAWPQFDENAAASLCYTSGTTGKHKGVLYSHRSTVLHAYVSALPDSMNISARDVVLPVVPMFHVNAWDLPYIAAATGAKMVFPGARLDGKSLYELLEAEAVSFSAGVPTVWQGLLAHTEAHGLKFSTMRRTLVGGAACPPAMLHLFQEKYGVHVLHAWGMTETSSLATLSLIKAKHRALTVEQREQLQCKQGHVVVGTDIKIVGPDGLDLPWDGKAFGELLVRGPWVARAYFNDAADPLRNGWFPTGDVATIDPDGYIQITDRRKDVIKSGGEWISSIEIENIAMSHPDVAMAACIAVRHPKWDERPLLVVVKKPTVDRPPTREDILALFKDKLAKWQIPDDVVFVDSIPLGPTGKMLKTRLREQFKDYSLPTL